MLRSILLSGMPKLKSKLITGGCPDREGRTGGTGEVLSLARSGPVVLRAGIRIRAVFPQEIANQIDAQLV